MSILPGLFAVKICIVVAFMQLKFTNVAEMTEISTRESCESLSDMCIYVMNNMNIIIQLSN